MLQKTQKTTPIPTLPDCTPLFSWYRENARALPFRATRDPYAIWVSEIMLQQTRVEAVLPYYHRFLTVLPNVASLAAADEAELLKLWEGLGYYSRVRNMQKAAQVIMTAHGGSFPRTFEEIRALPGVGDYTAGAIASFAFDCAVPAVDGNVLRVAARLCAYRENVLSTTAKKELTAAVAAAQPKESAATFNQAMIELGALVCLPNGAPKCAECPLSPACAAKRQGIEKELPVREKKKERKKEHRTVLILREGDRVALCRRPPKGLLAGLFEPLCFPLEMCEADVLRFLADHGAIPLYFSALEPSVHIFTHKEWHMVGFEAVLPEGTLDALSKKCHNGAENPFKGLFLAPREEIDTLYAIPSAYRAYRAFM